MALANDAAEIVEFSVKGTGKFCAAEAGRIKSLDQELLFDLGRLHGRSQPACELTPSDVGSAPGQMLRTRRAPRSPESRIRRPSASQAALRTACASLRRLRAACRF